MNLNKKNMKKIMYLIAFSALMLWGVFNYKMFVDFILFVLKLSTPLIIGICIAFIINVPMKQIERKIFNIDKRKNKKIFRVISLILSIVLIFGILGLITFLVVPELIQAVVSISKSLPKEFTWVNDIANKLSGVYPSIEEYIKNIDIKNLINTSFNSASSIVSIIISFLSTLISRLVLFFFGFIISIYILMDKEKLARQSKKFVAAFFPAKVAKEIIRIVKLTNETFTNFLTGQCLDAILLGILMFISLTVLKIPYALIISVLLSTTALIPYIGAFITLVVGALLIAVTSPIKAIWYIILFFVLQQIDENITYPRIVGKSVGLPALWALVAALIGGSMFGLLGIIVSIPLVSILYSLLRDWVNKKLENKDQDID